MTIRLAVFDIAGTVLDDSDNAVARCLCEALRARGVPAEEPMVDPVMGMHKPHAIRTIATRLRGGAPEDAWVEAVHADFQRRIIDHYRQSPNVRELEGATDLFAGLRSRGIRIGLDTGFDRPTLETILDRMRWRNAVDDTVATSEVARGRPDPEMIHVLMRRAGITDPGEVAKFGDSVSDIEQGLAARCAVVGAVLSDRTRPVLDRYPGVVPIRTLRDVLPAIEAVPA